MEQGLADSSRSTNETNLLLRKIDLQKQILLELLKKEGLDFDESQNAQEFSQKLFQWLTSQSTRQESLGWPLKEKGKILYSFEQEASPSVGLQALKTDSLLALCNGELSSASQEFIGLKCRTFVIRIEGSFIPQKKEGTKVEKGNVLALLEDPKTVKITVLNSQQGGIPVDLLSFF